MKPRSFSIRLVWPKGLLSDIANQMTWILSSTLKGPQSTPNPVNSYRGPPKLQGCAPLPRGILPYYSGGLGGARHAGLPRRNHSSRLPDLTAPRQSTTPRTALGGQAPRPSSQSRLLAPGPRALVPTLSGGSTWDDSKRQRDLSWQLCQSGSPTVLYLASPGASSSP